MCIPLNIGHRLTLACDNTRYICNSTEAGAEFFDDDQVNTILTTLCSMMRPDDRRPQRVLTAAIRALSTVIVLCAANFETSEERDYLMRTLCLMAENEDPNVQVAALECLVEVMAM